MCIILLIVSFSYAINLIIASDVAYVVRNSERIDQIVMDVFLEAGLEIDLIEDKMIDETDFSDYKFIFIGDERLRNINDIPDMPTIVANRYYAKQFGFLNNGVATKTASSSKLKLKKNGDIVEVYDRARFKLGGVSVPYYFLPNRSKNQEIDSIGTAFNDKGVENDVIAYTDKSCFFGIIESSYWTEEARELFEECVEFALGDNVHDVMIDEEFTNSVNGIRIKDLETNEFLLEETAQLTCNKEYKVDYRTKNVGIFVEDINFTGTLGEFIWTARKVGLEPDRTTTTGSKEIMIDFANGFYDLEIMAGILNDANPEDNMKSRRVEVVCENNI